MSGVPPPPTHALNRGESRHVAWSWRDARHAHCDKTERDGHTYSPHPCHTTCSDQSIGKSLTSTQRPYVLQLYKILKEEEEEEEEGGGGGEEEGGGGGGGRGRKKTKNKT